MVILYVPGFFALVMFNIPVALSTVKTSAKSMFDIASIILAFFGIPDGVIEAFSPR